MANQSNEKDRRPKSVDDVTPFRLSYVILKSGECVVGTTGQSFGAFTSAAGAAWWLRQFADGIERDGEAQAALERIWVWKDGFHYTQVSRARPDPKVHPEAVEYMRVMSRQEVEKIAGDGIDVQQYINSLLRQIEGQRRDINHLKATLALRDRENGALAEGYLSKLGIKPEDLR